MSLLKQIFVIIISIFIGAVCLAQKEKIDSLQKVLLTAKGIQRINCLNSLGKAYLFSSSGSAYWYVSRDSSLIFSNQAFHEAETLNYVQGMADAMFNKGKFKRDYREQEKDYLSAISLYKKCNNIDTLGQAYFSLGQALVSQANFPGAISAYKRAEELYREAKDSWNLGVTLTFIGLAYGLSGDYVKAFDYGYKALQAREKNKQRDTMGVVWALCNLGRLFQEVEDYPAAIDYYYTKSRDYAKSNGISLHNFFFDKISECWWRMQQYDSALYYMQAYVMPQQHDTAALNKILDDTTETHFQVGQIHLIRNEYDKCLRVLFNDMKISQARNYIVHQMELLAYIGEAYLGKGDYTNALISARKLLDLAQSTGAQQYIRDGTKQLWQVYDHQKSVDSAYFYYQRYTAMKDSVGNYRFLSQMTAFKEKNANEKKELEFQQQLQQESFTKKLLAFGFLVLISIGAIVIRVIMLKRRNEKLKMDHEMELQKLEGEKAKAAFKQQASELEMQALRAQMNPHFIFNSLNSINRFILQNNRTQASEYLTKFSKLVRMILQNSQESLISLESELESLKLYLDLEALRFDYRFGYKVSVPKDIDIDVLKVPPLILQPYVENAIWHGLMHREDKGQLDIEVTEENEFLYFRIADNGIGRKQAAAIASKSATKHKSMGLRITADRIAMLQKSTEGGSPVTVNDLVNDDGTAAGTEVVIKIPAIEQN